MLVGFGIVFELRIGGQGGKSKGEEGNMVFI